MINLGQKSGQYTGNGTSQDILFNNEWRALEIVSADRKYIMKFFKGDNTDTIGSAAIGSGGSYKQLSIVSGGVTELEQGFSIGDHISINENGTEYFWSVS